MRIEAYAALGDSFTAGRESVIGERWADRVAAGILDAGTFLEISPR